jgi:hypothetical protein
VGPDEVHPLYSHLQFRSAYGNGDGISVCYGLAKSVEVSVVAEIGCTPGEVKPKSAADIVDDEEKAFGLGEGVDGFDKFTCGQFLVPEGIMPVRGEDKGGSPWD